MKIDVTTWMENFRPTIDAIALDILSAPRDRREKLFHHYMLKFARGLKAAFADASPEEREEAAKDAMLAVLLRLDVILLSGGAGGGVA